MMYFCLAHPSGFSYSATARTAVSAQKVHTPSYRQAIMQRDSELHKSITENFTDLLHFYLNCFKPFNKHHFTTGIWSIIKKKISLLLWPVWLASPSRLTFSWFDLSEIVFTMALLLRLSVLPLFWRFKRNAITKIPLYLLLNPFRIW